MKFLKRRQTILDIRRDVPPTDGRLFENDVMYRYLNGGDGDDDETTALESSSLFRLPSNRIADFSFEWANNSCYIHSLFSVFYLAEPTFFRDALLGVNIMRDVDMSKLTDPCVKGPPLKEERRTDVAASADVDLWEFIEQHSQDDGSQVIFQRTFEPRPNEKITRIFVRRGRMKAADTDSEFSKDGQSVAVDNVQVIGTVHPDDDDRAQIQKHQLLSDGRIVINQLDNAASHISESNQTVAEFAKEIQKFLRQEYSKLYDESASSPTCSSEFRELLGKCLPSTRNGAQFEVVSFYNFFSVLFPSLKFSLPTYTLDVVEVGGGDGDNMWAAPVTSGGVHVIRTEEFLNIQKQAAEMIHRKTKGGGETVMKSLQIQRMFPIFDSKLYSQVTAARYDQLTSPVIVFEVATTAHVDLRNPYDGSNELSPTQRKFGNRILDGRYEIFAAIVNRGSGAHYGAVIKQGKVWYDYDDIAEVRRKKVDREYLGDDGVPNIAFQIQFSDRMAANDLIANRRRAMDIFLILKNWKSTNPSDLKTNMDSLRTNSWVLSELKFGESETIDRWIKTVDSYWTETVGKLNYKVAQTRPELLFYKRVDQPAAAGT